MPQKGSAKILAGDFRPLPLIAPTLNTSPDEYAVYLRSYSLYVDSLRALKSDFWSSVEDKEHKVQVKLEPGIRTAVLSKEGKTRASGVRLEGAPQALVAPKEGFLVEEPVMIPVKKVVSVEKPAEKQALKKLPDPDRKRAKRARWRQNRRVRDLAESAKVASSLAKLEKENVTVAEAAAKLGEKEWTVVTRRGKMVQKKTPKIAQASTAGPKTRSVKAKGAKGKGPAKGLPKGGPSAGPPKPPKPPGPSGSGGDSSKLNEPDPAPKGDQKGKKVDKPSNRKERRRATYGPPPKEVVEAPPAKEEPEPFSWGDSSEDEKPKTKAVIWPPPKESWQLESDSTEAVAVGLSRFPLRGQAIEPTDPAMSRLAHAIVLDRPVGLEPMRQSTAQKLHVLHAVAKKGVANK